MRACIQILWVLPVRIVRRLVGIIGDHDVEPGDWHALARHARKARVNVLAMRALVFRHIIE